MLMRYHGGLGIGHTQFQRDSKCSQGSAVLDGGGDDDNASGDEDAADGQCRSPISLGKDISTLEGEDGYQSDDPELGIVGIWGDDGFDQSSSDENAELEKDWNEEAESDEEYLELMDSYYTDY
jgi:hypothetical protein